VWRRVEVPSTTTLHQLSAELEAAMGWLGGHLHSFDAAGVIYQLPSDDDFGWRPTKDERRAVLRTVLPRVKMTMQWDYDFGDGWTHDVTVEAIEPVADSVTYPRCVTGRRACPPEDCGGPWGYAELLEALADPAHPEHEAMLEWAPPAFDPAQFDPAQATEAMRHAEPWDLD